MDADLSRQVAEVMGWTCKEPDTGKWWYHPDHVPRCLCPDYAHDLNLAMELVPEDADLTLEGNNKDGWWACIHVGGRSLSEAATGEHKIHASAICLARLDLEKVRALGEESDQ